MKVRTITPPATYPVSLAEAKLHARIDGTAEDTLVTDIIVAATEAVEKHLGRSLITQTRELYLDCFPLSGIRLPYSRVQSITSVTYIDENESTQTLSASTYRLDDKAEPALLYPKTSWPATAGVTNAVTIRYIAGYGTATDVPAPIRLALRNIIARAYLYREEPSIGGSARALGPYRVWLSC